MDELTIAKAACCTPEADARCCDPSDNGPTLSEPITTYDRGDPFPRLAT